MRVTADWLADYAMRQGRQKSPETAQNGPVARPAGREATHAPAPTEASILAAILAALEMHPDVAFVWRQNTAAFRIEDRYVKAGFPGCSDVLGMLRGGCLLAIEVKRLGRQLTPEQQGFLFNVARNGGCAFCARSVDDVFAGIKAFLRGGGEAA